MRLPAILITGETAILNPDMKRRYYFEDYAHPCKIPTLAGLPLTLHGWKAGYPLPPSTGGPFDYGKSNPSLSIDGRDSVRTVRKTKAKPHQQHLFPKARAHLMVVLNHWTNDVATIG